MPLWKTPVSIKIPIPNHLLPTPDEQYYKLPPLFSLDDYQPCLASAGGQYCLGSFHLTAEGDNQVYDVLLVSIVLVLIDDRMRGVISLMRLCICLRWRSSQTFFG
jgi:hypothetical protein